MSKSLINKEKSPSVSKALLTHIRSFITKYAKKLPNQKNTLLAAYESRSFYL